MAIDQVGGARREVTGYGRALGLAPPDAVEAEALHEPPHLVAARGLTFATEFAPDLAHLWVPKMSSDLLARDDAYRDLSFRTAVRPLLTWYDQGWDRVMRRYDVPAHRQDRVDPPHSFNPFILFTGPDEVFGTHTPPFSEEERDRLVTLADMGARCRSTVVRDRYKGDSVELIPEAESPGRLAGALSQLTAGMRMVGTPDHELWRLTRAAALGGLHPIRYSVIEYLVAESDSHIASTIAARARLKETTVRRHVDDLVALGVLDLVHTRPDEWAASNWLRADPRLGRS